MDAAFVIVLTTLPRDHDSSALARTLVNERLVACVNLLPPMRSVYSWRNAVEETDEQQVVMKTTRSQVRALEARIKALHPYEVPEFVVIPIIDGSSDYLAWLSANT
jgi:periplasmic divalent cation tolerance protein